jgi:serine phosphatase RsbU (regulator of sigma subunit)
LVAFPTPLRTFRVVVFDATDPVQAVGEFLVDSGELFEFVRLPATRAARCRHLLAEAHCVVVAGERREVLDRLGWVRRRDLAVPVVVLATGSVGWAVEALAAGAQDVLDRDELDAALLARSLRYAVERQHAERAVRDLREAHLRRDEQGRLERGLVPVPLLRSPSLSWGAVFRAGGGRRLLGGDFFDVVELDDGRVRVVVGDVCGHGPDEAALGVALRVAWRSLVLAGTDAEVTVAGVDAVLRAETQTGRATFATVCDATISADRRRVEVRLAGHPPPILLQGSPRLLEPPRVAPPLGLGLGISDRWAPCRWDLPERWVLLVSTDGLFEVYRRDGTLLGQDGLVDLLASLGPPGGGDLDRWSAEVVAHVEALSARPLADDVALVALGHDPGRQGCPARA